ncbi:Ig-like domain-containing protein, partial [Tenacibaculum maritimum]
DADGNTDPAIIKVTVTDVVETSDLAIGDENVNTPENTAITVTPVLTGTPIGAVTYGITGGADQGLFTIDPVTGAVTLAGQDFENPADANGDNVYEVEVTVTDADGNTDPAIIKVTVTDVNDTPIGVNDTLIVEEDSTSGIDNQINVGINDDLGIDGGDGDNYSLDPANGPNNGTVSEVSDGVFEYIPNPDFTGNDSFTYIITDANGDTDTATVIVTVNVTPDAVDDTVTTTEDTAVIVGIYDNDNDIPTEGDLTTTDPENGTVTIDDGGTPNDPSDDIVTYTPDEGFTGIDTFDYTICDNASPANCSTATVTVEVTENLDTCVVVFNEFSPNGDGINDYLKIECIEKFKDNTVEIFNRWGNTVYSVKGYSNNDPNNRFEGISNGRANIQVEKKLPVGTYFYVLDLGNGSPLRKGWIYINR